MLLGRFVKSKIHSRKVSSEVHVDVVLNCGPNGSIIGRYLFMIMLVSEIELA